MRRSAIGIVLAALISLWLVGTTAGAEHLVGFGAHVKNRGSETRQEAIQSLENAIGRPLAVVRVFYRWDSALDEQPVRWLVDTGRTVFMSVKARRLDGTSVSWREIADAQPGSPLYQDMVRWADAVKTLGPLVYFTFNHEPELKISAGSGTNVEFIDAWRKVVTVFREQGVSNARHTWVLSSGSFAATDARAADLWYPGDEWVDVIGVDAYNWYTCRKNTSTPWRSLSTIIEPFRAFGATHATEGLAIGEWGSVEDAQDPTRKGLWIDEARVDLAGAQWERLEVVTYFHSADQENTDCQFFVDSSQGSLDAFTAMGADPRYQGLMPPPPPSPPADTAPPTVAITHPADGSTVARGSTVTIAADAADDVGVTQIQFRVNGSLKCTDQTSAYTCAWKVPNGRKSASYTIEAKAYDAVGNFATHSVTVTSK